MPVAIWNASRLFPRYRYVSVPSGRGLPVGYSGPVINARPAHSTVSLFSISLTPLTETRFVWLATLSRVPLHCHIHCQLNTFRYYENLYGRVNYRIRIGNSIMRFIHARLAAEYARSLRPASRECVESGDVNTRGPPLHGSPSEPDRQHCITCKALQAQSAADLRARQRLDGIRASDTLVSIMQLREIM